MAVDVLIGTGNPSKAALFKRLLNGTNAHVLTLSDLHITDEPAETGKTPLENAHIKAMFYSRYCDRVIANDAGLYFFDLPLFDPRQPGLHVRTPQGVRLEDEQMIAYYSTLVHTLGGRVTAGYLDAITV